MKDLVEEQLFAHRRDLFSQVDLVFMDTTSRYFEGQGGQTLGEHGFSKDHRPVASDDPCRGVRRRWTSGALGDVARQHRRCDESGAGDRRPRRVSPSAGSVSSLTAV